MGLFSSNSRGTVATQPGAGMPQKAMDRGFSSASSMSSGYGAPKRHTPTFPRQWYAFVKKYNLKSMALKVGESKDNPIYSVSMPWGYYGKMQLHNGPDPERDPVIATATAKQMGMLFSSYINLPGGIHTELKASFGTSKYDFECPVGPNGEVEKFQWRGGKLGMSRTWNLIRLATGEVMATWNEGKMGISMPTALTFNFVDDRALDGSFGPVFPVMAAFTGLRSWQSTKNVRYTTGTGVGTSVAAGTA